MKLVFRAGNACAQVTCLRAASSAAAAALISAMTSSCTRVSAAAEGSEGRCATTQHACQCNSMHASAMRHLFCVGLRGHGGLYFSNHFTACTLVELRMWSKMHSSHAAANTAQPRRANLGKVLEAARAVLPRQHSVEERCDAFFIKHANEIDELLL